MITEKEQFILIAGMAFVTCIPRILPLGLLSKISLSPNVQRTLSFIAPAIFGALLAPSLWFAYKTGESPVKIRDYTVILSAIPTALVGWKTGSFLLAMLSGIASCAFLRYLNIF